MYKNGCYLNKEPPFFMFSECFLKDSYSDSFIAESI